MIIGVTGNSGSGKTLVSEVLKKEYNANVIDADEVVKEMSLKGNIYYNEIVKVFGKNILLENKEIDKQKLANIIFNDEVKRKELNLLTFKYVVEEIKKRVKSGSKEICIIDAPLLIESDLNELCDIVIAVIADKNVKIKRICKRDGIDESLAKSRIEAQANNDFYVKNSNYVIINNDNFNLEKQIGSIKEIIESNLIKQKETVVIQNEFVRILKFKKLLEYSDIIEHAFTLKPLDFGNNESYKNKKEEVDNNYKLVCNLLNVDSKNIIRPHQTHTNNIKEVNNEIGMFEENFIGVDGLVTKEKNKILSLAFADCTPIYLFDKAKKIIGNIHSGWQGTTKKIAKKAIEFMKQKYSCNAEDIICVIGPTIRKCHFEVKQDVRDIFYNEFKYMKNIDKIIEYNKEKESYYIDTVEINKNLLKEEGILEENIVDSKICTVCDSNIIHSFRKEGKKSGRNTSLICLK